MEQFLRDDLSAAELAAFDQGVTDALYQRNDNHVTSNIAFAYFADAANALGRNINGSNLYLLYWSGVHETLSKVESEEVKTRKPLAWRELAGDKAKGLDPNRYHFGFPR
jgi:hypothetical protein